jgi:hypothetical protein
MSQSYVLLDRISVLVQYLQGFPQQVRFERRGHKLDECTPFDHICYCSQAFLSGALPDAKTLEYVAIAFNKYVTRVGEISLDEAFGLKSKPKAGNPSRQAAQHLKMNNLLATMAQLRGGDPKLSLAKSAEMALCGDESIEAETLVREYRRRGYKREAEAWAKVLAAASKRQIND